MAHGLRIEHARSGRDPQEVGWEAGIGSTPRGTAPACGAYLGLMKMRATIEVEFEAAQGQTEGGLEAALLRGLVSLKSAIEYRVTGSPTGPKYGSGGTRVEVVEKSIIA